MHHEVAEILAALKQCGEIHLWSCPSSRLTASMVKLFVRSKEITHRSYWCAVAVLGTLGCGRQGTLGLTLASLVRAIRTVGHPVTHQGNIQTLHATTLKLVREAR